MKYINFMPNKFRQLKQNKPTLILTFLFIIVGVFFITQGAHAVGDFFTGVFGAITDPISFLTKLLLGLFLIIIQFLGVLFVFFVSIMIDIAQFNTFINMPMVEVGWGLARDVANMFFIVVLLIIAFSTVLKISSYHYQKTLTKLLIMAILVNFSKLIAGFLIDFFQVIMLTFVNGFKDAAAGNLAQGFGIYEMLAQAPGITSTDSLQEGFVVAGALAVVMILVADMVVLIMIAVLLWRIAMLWVLVIISPLAYLSYAFMPKYWSQWWQMFFQHLISGPVIAFFLWLALLTMQQGEITKDFNKKSTVEMQSEMAKIIPSQVNQSVLLNYMVVMALLLGGLTISQKVAAQSGSAVGNFAQKVQKVGTRAAMIGTGVAAAGWALKKAPSKAGGLLSRSEGVRNVLGAIGGKRYLPGLNTLATRTLAMAENKRTADKKKVNDIYGSINDTRILSRFANSKIPSVKRDIMRKKAPSLVKDTAKARDILANMEADDFARLSDAEIYNIGNRGIDLRGTRHEDTLSRNRYRRGIYNSGALNAGFDTRVAGRDDQGNLLAGDATLNTPGDAVFGRDIHPSDLPKISRSGNYAHQYREVTESGIKGSGNLSVNEFARGQANVLAVNFDDELLKKLDLLKGATGDPSNVKGINIQDQKELKETAKALMQVFDNEIQKLKSTGGSSSKIENLILAKERLANPENLSHLNLVNSSSRGYSLSDLKETVVHEKIHGYGLADELTTDKLTKSIVENKQYDQIEKLTREKISGNNKPKEVSEILKNESKEARDDKLINLLNEKLSIHNNSSNLDKSDVNDLISVLNDIKKSIDKNKSVPVINELLLDYSKNINSLSDRINKANKES